MMSVAQDAVSVTEAISSVASPGDGVQTPEAHSVQTLHTAVVAHAAGPPLSVMLPVSPECSGVAEAWAADAVLAAGTDGDA